MDWLGFEPLKEYVGLRISEFGLIHEERKERLMMLADLISESESWPVKLIFICTHNSRRSIYAQAWMYAASRYFDLDWIESWSGGTEASEVKDTVVLSLTDAGFLVSKVGQEEKNPGYILSAGDGIEGIILRSERFSSMPDPGSGFAAVMVCSDADEACPLVPGAEARFPLHYVDPKSSDGTISEKDTYARVCRLIAREVFYITENIIL